MNFNHLVSRAEMMRPCMRDRHTYYPSGHVEAMVGGNVAVRFRCKKCGELTTSFLTRSEYEIHKNIIENYIGSKGV